MRGRTANDGTQADDGIITPLGGHFFGQQRDFKGPRNLDDVDVFIPGPGAQQGVHGTADEFFGDKIVETAHDEGKFFTFRQQFGFQNSRHGISFSVGRWESSRSVRPIIGFHGYGVESTVFSMWPIFSFLQFR
jgi:hypothetical protein